jgi:hypothetical protein
MTRRTIKCGTLEQFLDCVAGLTERGHGFEADAATLQIHLTGAF